MELIQISVLFRKVNHFEMPAYNVGLGLNLTGQDDEQAIDAETNGYPQEQYYVPYAQGMQLYCKLY